MSTSAQRQPTSAHGLIQTARGACTDGAPHTDIDRLLGRAVDAVKDVEADRDRLRKAIQEHRAGIEDAGPVRVADYDSAGRAEAKHAADRRLWEALGRDFGEEHNDA